jgi:tetratricopeptide (TPR) repeat protein
MQPLTTGRRGAAPVLLVVFLLAAAAGIMALKVATDHIPRAKVPGSSIIYLPSGKYLKYATFGYSSLAADLIYLWSIQYYSNYEIADRFAYLERIFSIISELDPRYTDPYEVGALIAVAEAQDPELALKILDMGLAKNPEQWVFPFEAGHIAQMTLKDFERAQQYYEKCLTIPGAPAFVSRLRANAMYKRGDLQTAWETWLEIYDSAADEEVRKVASNHLYQVKAAIDIGDLTDAVKAFEARFRRLPTTLDDLTRTGIRGALPKDLDGQDYVYDPATGAVKAPTIPWKR